MSNVFLFPKSRFQLKEILDQENIERIFFIHGKNSYLPIAHEFSYLEKDFNITHFYEFKNNPCTSDLMHAIAYFKNSQSQIILALGGGSVLDMAKLISVFAINNILPNDYLNLSQKSEFTQKVKVIAIPTTAGTGSEVTPFATLWNDGKKYSVESILAKPDYAIVDCELSHLAPPHIKASSGFDALCQAVESFWNIYSTEESRTLAQDAIEKILANFTNSIQEGSLDASALMAEAAFKAGQAISMTKTTAAHAVSYPLTYHFGISHGHAVALTLGSFFEFNKNICHEDCNDSRGVQYVQDTLKELSRIMKVNFSDNFNTYWTQLMEQYGLKTKLSELKIKRTDIPMIISESFNPARVKNNPRRLTASQLEIILNDIF